MSSVATDADRRALANAEAASQDAWRQAHADELMRSCLDAELRLLQAESRARDAEREVQMLQAAYGNCQNDLAAARGQRQPDVVALADGLIRSLGTDGAEVLHRELGDVLMTRLVSGA